jgi:four helix bundle protein
MNYYLKEAADKHHGYKKLEIWQLARDISVEVHNMSVICLPKHEMYETGCQIRRSSKSVRSLIVEGYGRRYYKQEFVRYLIYALASNGETLDHLETLYETNSLQDEILCNKLHEKIDLLGKKLYVFTNSVKKDHISEK